MTEEQKQLKVWDREKTEFGIATGEEEECDMESCGGTLIEVKWPSGTATLVCTKALSYINENEAQIL